MSLSDAIYSTDITTCVSQCHLRVNAIVELLFTEQSQWRQEGDIR